MRFGSPVSSKHSITTQHTVNESEGEGGGVQFNPIKGEGVRGPEERRASIAFRLSQGNKNQAKKLCVK